MREVQKGASSKIPMHETRGRHRAWHRRSSLPWGSWISRVGGVVGWAEEAVAISWGRWECRIPGLVVWDVKIAAKGLLEVGGVGGVSSGLSWSSERGVWCSGDSTASSSSLFPSCC